MPVTPSKESLEYLAKKSPAGYKLLQVIAFVAFLVLAFGGISTVLRVLLP